jgi:exodeoxyribonuclease III
MRVATFNVNSIRSRLDILLNWLRDYQPDLLALQETKVTDDLFPAAPFKAEGYHVYFRGQKSYNGVALFSRIPAVRVHYGFEDEPADETRLQWAEFKGLHVVNTYVPQGRHIDHPMYAYKIKWFHRLRSWFDQRFGSRARLLWVGDMNVAHEPIDVHNPEAREKHVCYHKDARAAFAHCRGWGFIDSFRLHHPEPGHYTFFDYRNPRNVKDGKGWRIDYILASPRLARVCTDAHIDLTPRLKPRPSDHAVLTAEFDGE